MHIRLKTDITQEQIDSGYDYTLLALHGRFVKWLLSLEMPIVSFSLCWEMMPDDEPHMVIVAELVKNCPVKIDEEFFDECHLGGREEEEDG